MFADLSGSTALVLSERMTERSIGRIGSIVQRERAASLGRSGWTRWSWQLRAPDRRSPWWLLPGQSFQGYVGLHLGVRGTRANASVLLIPRAAFCPRCCWRRPKTEPLLRVVPTQN